MPQIRALKKICSLKDNLQHILLASEQNDLSSFQVAFVSAAINCVMILTQSKEDTKDNADYEAIMMKCLHSMNLKVANAKSILR